MEKINDNDCLTWRVWPMFERNVKTLLMLIVVISFLLAVFVFSKDYLVVFLVTIVLIFELRKYIFPTFFKLNNDGIFVKTFYKEKFYHWTQFRSVLVDKNGVLFSPYKSKSFLEKFRGLYVLFGANTPSGAKEYILSKY